MLLALWSWRTGEWGERYAGWDVFPNTRRRTRKQVLAERERLGVSRETIEKTAEKVVEQSKADRTFSKIKIEYGSQQEVVDLTYLLMEELRVTVKLPDYTRAIAIALAMKKREEEDEEDALLLLM